MDRRLVALADLLIGPANLILGNFYVTNFGRSFRRFVAQLNYVMGFVFRSQRLLTLIPFARELALHGVNTVLNDSRRRERRPIVINTKVPIASLRPR